MNDRAVTPEPGSNVTMLENGHGDLSNDVDQNTELTKRDGSVCGSECNMDASDQDFTDNSLLDSVTKEEYSRWQLPPSSEDLLLPNEHLFGALEVYELCRHFSQSLQLSPFLFESFCAALMCRNQSSLLDNIHLALLRAIFRDEDSSDTHLVPQDSTGHFNQTLFVLDRNTYGEVLRRYLESDQRFPNNIISTLENGNYPFVEISERLTVLLWLSERALQTQLIRDKVQNSEGLTKNDDHCRSVMVCTLLRSVKINSVSLGTTINSACKKQKQ
ncbi:DDT domain containing protein [Trichuris trichiura]|uniref:DDT domain containing protein n=1 Tax=Trichuris trichiura TaxID=36087 RepID=A0A077ZDL6_TRITR|nr:DDT domain containing protein [Trichuris trichiura]